MPSRFFLKPEDLMLDILATRVEYMSGLNRKEIQKLPRAEKRALYERGELTIEAITTAVNQRISGWPLYKRILFKLVNGYQ